MKHLQLFLPEPALEGIPFPAHILDTLVVGSGCAGFNAVDWLCDLGRQDIALLTEGVNMGTSRNTGSDKQTYYKLSMASDGADSVAEMAQTLFSGGSVNGDTALIEAACSVRSFIKLANLGVPFPTNQYGEYVGYKTDHDPRQRATSAGPLTSKYMTECLERSVRGKDIPILDQMQAVQLLSDGKRVYGLLALDCRQLNTPHRGLTLFFANNLIVATGGPAGAYYHSVYPESQTGMTGMLLEAGAQAVNLQDWQYGLASVQFRWNLSGSYQQVLPRYLSMDREGRCREFLPDYFDTPEEALNQVFLKGYQWPFDVSKVRGSSVMDLIVHHEIFHKGNRVFLDYTTDPMGISFQKGREAAFQGLSEECRHYLEQSDILVETPIQRLEQMNPKAIALYRSHGIDLYKDLLEISVCAQHCNGGIGVDADWRTNLEGLYVAGEAAGTFGPFRPGGSALNSTQVGSMRAAQKICETPLSLPQEDWGRLVNRTVGEYIRSVLSVPVRSGAPSSLLERRTHFQKEMSAHLSHIRSLSQIPQLRRELTEELRTFFGGAELTTGEELPHLLKNRDIFITQLALLSAMEWTIQTLGSRGSGLALDSDGEALDGPLNVYRFLPGKEAKDQCVLTTLSAQDSFSSCFQKVRPLPEGGGWFETVWREYDRRTANIQQQLHQHCKRV